MWRGCILWQICVNSGRITQWVRIYNELKNHQCFIWRNKQVNWKAEQSVQQTSWKIWRGGAPQGNTQLSHIYRKHSINVTGCNKESYSIFFFFFYCKQLLIFMSPRFPLCPHLSKLIRKSGVPTFCVGKRFEPRKPLPLCSNSHLWPTSEPQESSEPVS